MLGLRVWQALCLDYIYRRLTRGNPGVSKKQTLAPQQSLSTNFYAYVLIIILSKVFSSISERIKQNRIFAVYITSSTREMLIGRSRVRVESAWLIILIFCDFISFFLSFLVSLICCASELMLDAFLHEFECRNGGFHS